MPDSLISDNKLIIAVSSCLLGERVRYDGKEKFSDDIERLRESNIDLISICPEVAIGLSVPRPALQVVNIDGHLKVRGVKNPEQDVTQALMDYAQTIIDAYPHLCGYVFKARSPSCGVSDTPVFSLLSLQGSELSEGSGLFAKYIIENSHFPVVDENGLSTPEQRAEFLAAVTDYSQRIAKIK